MKVYKVRGGDDYHTCWVVAENAPRARRIASQESKKVNGYEPSDLTARRHQAMEYGLDLTEPRFLYDIDTGTEPGYYDYPY